MVQPDHLFVGGDEHHIKVVYFGKFCGFGIGGPCHAGQLIVHAEIVLKGDGGQRLIFLLDSHALFCFQCLMQAVTITAAGHEPAGKFIYYYDLTIFNNIVDIFGEKSIAFEQLIDNMVAGELLLVLAANSITALSLFFRGEAGVLIDILQFYI